MQDESQLQIQCVRWFRYQYPKLAPLLIHIPNGRHRSKRESMTIDEVVYEIDQIKAILR